MKEIDKYAKIMILSTLAESRAIVDVSFLWFKNKGRLYQPANVKAIQSVVKDGYLTQDGKFYQANIEKLLQQVMLSEDHKLAKKYRDALQRFYTKLGAYTQRVYLNDEVIKVLTNFEHQKADALDMGLVFQLPFILRYLEYKDKETANLIIQVLHLEEYVKLLEKQEIQYYHILKENKMMDDLIQQVDNILALLRKMQKSELAVFEKNFNIMKQLGG
jgi:hypothetical protein